MRQGKLLFSLVLGLTLFVALSQQASAKRIEGSETAAPVEKPKSKRNAWIVSQKTDGLKTYTVCVGGDAIKFVCGSLSVIAHQPDWQIVLLNERAKTYWQMPLKEFTGLKGMETFDVKKLEPAKTKEAPDYHIAKRAVVAQEGKPEPDADKTKKLGFKPAKITVWSSKDVKVDPGALSIFTRLYGLEGLEGVPMRIQMTTEKGEEIECLSTDWCFDREVSQDFFDVPKQFKKGISLNEVETQQAVTTLRSQLKRGGNVKKLHKGESQNVPPETGPTPGSTPKPTSGSTAKPTSGSTAKQHLVHLPNQQSERRNRRPKLPKYSAMDVRNGTQISCRGDATRRPQAPHQTGGCRHLQRPPLTISKFANRLL